MAKGYVDVMFAKDDKNGQKRYSFKIKNDEAWYSCGIVDPRIKKGDQIEFDFEQNGTWNNVNVDSVKILRSGPEVVEAKKSFGGFKAKGDPAKDQYWKDRETRDIATQQRIQLQASRNAAIEVVAIMVQAQAVKIPEKQSARHDAIAGLIAEWTERFQNETNGIHEDASVTTGVVAEVAGDTKKTANDGWEE